MILKVSVADIVSLCILGSGTASHWDRQGTQITITEIISSTVLLISPPHLNGQEGVDIDMALVPASEYLPDTIPEQKDGNAVQLRDDSPLHRG